MRSRVLLHASACKARLLVIFGAAECRLRHGRRKLPGGFGEGGALSKGGRPVLPGQTEPHRLVAAAQRRAQRRGGILLHKLEGRRAAAARNDPTRGIVTLGKCTCCDLLHRHMLHRVAGSPFFCHDGACPRHGESTSGRRGGSQRQSCSTWACRPSTASSPHGLADGPVGWLASAARLLPCGRLAAAPPPGGRRPAVRPSGWP